MNKKNLVIIQAILVICATPAIGSDAHVYPKHQESEISKIDQSFQRIKNKWNAENLHRDENGELLNSNGFCMGRDCRNLFPAPTIMGRNLTQNESEQLAKVLGDATQEMWHHMWEAEYYYDHMKDLKVKPAIMGAVGGAMSKMGSGPYGPIIGSLIGFVSGIVVKACSDFYDALYHTSEANDIAAFIDYWSEIYWTGYNPCENEPTPQPGDYNY